MYYYFIYLLLFYFIINSSNTIITLSQWFSNFLGRATTLNL